jgi:F-type H+-transporting ATPase subunit gamma
LNIKKRRILKMIRDIKRRIDSAQDTRKITRAMKMVAAAKLRKYQKKVEDARPFFNKTREILSNLARNTRESREHPLLTVRKGGKNLYIIITSDHGLCGPYNARIIELAEKRLSQEKEARLIVIGRKGRNYFNLRGYEILSEYLKIDDYPDAEFISKVSQEVITLFTEKLVDRVSIIYTHFTSPINQTCRALPLLPVHIMQETEEGNRVEYIYEPSPEEVLDLLLPKYVNSLLFSTLLESRVSEFGSRMTAMDAATDNAGELINQLTLLYNRARQAAITGEITEIVGGAGAFK